MKCPYCGSETVLKDSSIVYGGRSFGMIWICSRYPGCDAYVGVHKGTDTPLGRLANKELRRWKKKAHSMFDPIWKSGFYNRTTAYDMLATKMGKPIEETHIGMFDVQECKDVERISWDFRIKNGIK